MIQRVILLSRETEFAAMAMRTFERYGIEHAKTADRLDGISIVTLESYFDIAIVDKIFLGDSFYTARLVKRLRRHYFKPLIGLDTYGEGDLFPLQVAGCNFQLRMRERTALEICGQLCEMINQISLEMEQLPRPSENASPS